MIRHWTFTRLVAFCVTLAQAQQAAPAPSCPGGTITEALDFADIQASVETKMSEFAQSPEILSRAQKTFQILKGAENPIIKTWLESRSLQNADAETIAKAWASYYAKNFVLAKYPSKDVPNEKVEALFDGIYAQHLPLKVQKRFERVFAETQKLALKRVEAFPIPAAEKIEISKKLSAIRLYWMKKFNESKYRAYPLEAISWSAAYDPVHNEINMGLEALKYFGDDTLRAVFAHEMGHAIDPCRWSAFFITPNPFDSVTTCLRKPESVGAKPRDDSSLASLVKKGVVSPDLAQSLAQNPTCNKAAYPPIGVQADQILESFADWFAAEVISLSASKKFPRADLCIEHPLNPGSSYPTNEARLNRIYLAHPTIRKNLKRETDTSLTYCSMKPAPSSTASESKK